MEIVEILGWVFIGIVAVIALVGLTFGLRSIPDARRYLKMRRM